MVNSTKNPLVYTFHSNSIQAILINGVAWFNASEVCKALSFKNTRQAIQTHVDIEDVQKLDTLTNGGNQKASYVNESGIFALIFGSSKSEAKEFKRWVTSEVLPAIRKTGEYTAKKRLPSRTKYYYPKETLRQPHFMNQRGTLLLGANSLVSDHFVSPLMSLLNQLRTDGHQIEGAFDEAMAYRLAIKQMNEALEKVQDISLRAQIRSPLKDDS